MCQFIETIQYKDRQFYHLEFHQERVNRTFENFFSQKPPFNLELILNSTKRPVKGFYRCRIVYGSDIRSIEFIEHEPRTIRTLKIVRCDSIDYSYKYLDRELIQDLTKQKQEEDDILIIKNGLVTDTSIGNILFHDGEQWVTPGSALLQGTTSARLLKGGVIKEGEIKLSDISS